ncbi:MAG: hypothetical protein N3J91_09265 [Verrucomicrobiae bacterium]|nr:hypothetical protein [Verrucomicrobiae bacterium]
MAKKKLTVTVQPGKLAGLTAIANDLGVEPQVLVQLMITAFLEMYEAERRLVLPLMVTQLDDN